MTLKRALLALLVSVSTAWADPSGAGTTGAGFLRLGPGPKAVAMGEAFVGLADDVNAVYYNPAGLATLKRQELTLMHNELFTDIRQEWLAYALPTRTFGTFALSIDVQHVLPFESFDANDSPGSLISAQDAAYGLAYARRLAGGLALGVGAKLIKSRLNDSKASGAAFDAGVLYETPVEGLKAGASILNMGAPMRFINEYFQLPLAGKAGASYRITSLKDWGHEFTVVSDVTVYRGRSAAGGAGIEYLRQSALALRAGWTGTQAAGYGLTLGAGVDINRLTKGHLPELAFDYAFQGLGELSESHRASMTLRFGGRIEPGEEPEPEAPAPSRRLRPTPESTPKVSPEPTPRQDDGSERIWVNP